MEEGIINFLKKYLIVRRDEVCDFLSNKYNIKCSIHIVSYVLKELKMMHKIAY